MKYKLIILIFVLASCSSVNLNKAAIDPYSSSCFALIYNDKDFEKYDWGSMKRMVENNEYDCLLDWVRTETGSNDNHFLGAKIYEDNRRMTNGHVFQTVV